MKPYLLAGALLTLFVLGCSSATFTVRDDTGLGVVLYSDSDYATLRAKPTTLDDLATDLMSGQSAKLLPRTRVEILRRESLPIRSNVAAPVDWPFDRVRIGSGPAAGREGWISDLHIDGKPALSPASSP